MSDLPEKFEFAKKEFDRRGHTLRVESNGTFSVTIGDSRYPVVNSVGWEEIEIFFFDVCGFSLAGSSVVSELTDPERIEEVGSDFNGELDDLIEYFNKRKGLPLDTILDLLKAQVEGMS